MFDVLFIRKHIIRTISSMDVLVPQGNYHRTFIGFIQFIEVTDLTNCTCFIIKRNDYLIMCGCINRLLLNDILHF